MFGSEKDVVGYARQIATGLYAKHKVEFGGTIVKDANGAFSIGRFLTDYNFGRLPSLSNLQGYAHFHTHPSTHSFSTGDVSVAVINRLQKSFVFTTDGSTRVFDASGYRQIHDWRSRSHYMTDQQVMDAARYISIY
jgi:hypothetical protein